MMSTLLKLGLSGYAPIHIQYERFLSGIGGGDDAIAIGYLSGNRCHVARDDTIAISASNVVG